MGLPIEAYAFLSNLHTAALVGNNGSIDWFCAPRFDSPACFAALLGTHKHGAWRIAPASDEVRVKRAYRPGTLILETEFTTPEGSVRVTDCLLPEHSPPRLLRVVTGLRGTVPMRMAMRVRFNYGGIVPWVLRRDGGLQAIAGPDGLMLHTDVPVRGHNLTTVARFDVEAGQQCSFLLSWFPAHEPAPRALDPARSLSAASRWWRGWSSTCTYQGAYASDVLSSLTVLKGLTYAPTGGLIAAPTTSLPEELGGVRNWDYRYCWLRDATLSLLALLLGGFQEEALAWRDWLLRAVAGDMRQLQIMYGAAGERQLTEEEVPWLPGHANSTPVRIGNGAAGQLQLDVHGEVMDCLYQARRAGLPPDAWAWRMQLRLVETLESLWQKPDEGIWEVRGPPRHFVHSKVMAWVAFDRAIKTVSAWGHEGPVARWRSLRRTIHRDVCAQGFDASRNTFTQSYGSSALDASVLMMPMVGFLPAKDPRMLGTVRAIEQHLVRDGGLVDRYSAEAQGHVDGVTGGEGSFLACSFWLAENYALQDRCKEATQLFELLLSLRNDVGLLAEQYDPRAKRQLGNFPQAFSHLCLVTTAHTLGSQGAKCLRKPGRNT